MAPDYPLFSKLVLDKLSSTPFGMAIYFISSVLIVLVVAYLSFTYYERFFIQIKKRLMIIKSESSKQE